MDLGRPTARLSRAPGTGYLVTVPEFPRRTLKISGKVTGSLIVTLKAARLPQVTPGRGRALPLGRRFHLHQSSPDRYYGSRSVAPDAAIDLAWTRAYAVGSREDGKHDGFVCCRDQP